jgi:AraC-like DNA-binding protein
MRTRASISTLLISPLVAALAPLSGALERLFDATDLTKELIADRDGRVTPAQFCVAWAETVRLSGDPTLALSLADATPLGAFGIVEYICRASPTLQTALEQWCRYLNILDDAVEVAMVEVDGGACLRVQCESDAPAPASHELCFALVARHVKALLGFSAVPLFVEFAHRSTDKVHQRKHVQFFGAPVRFGATHTQIAFSKKHLESPLPSSDPNLLTILLSAAETRATSIPSQLPLTEQVSRTLKDAMRDNEAELDAIAQRLGMTGRSLQRRLRDEGTTFQAVRDAARQNLADHYLSQGLTFAEISFLLGFSEPSAFFRAFKRWTGFTPLEQRLRQSIGSTA